MWEKHLTGIKETELHRNDHRYHINKITELNKNFKVLVPQRNLCIQIQTSQYSFASVKQMRVGQSFLVSNFSP